MNEHERCENCAGSGLVLNGIGEPDTCPECHGNTVVPAETMPARAEVIDLLKQLHEAVWDANVQERQLGAAESVLAYRAIDAAVAALTSDAKDKRIAELEGERDDFRGSLATTIGKLMVAEACAEKAEAQLAALTSKSGNAELIERLRALRGTLPAGGYGQATIDLTLAVLRSPAPEAWQPIETAPKDASELLLRVPGERGRFRAVVGHWASDLSGEEQPPFRGWFYNTGYGFAEISPTPTQWARLSLDLNKEEGE